MSEQNNRKYIRARCYGTSGPSVYVLHGGPGAPGYMVPVARRLADYFQVIEPFQRGSDNAECLTVQRHVTDLHDLITVKGQQHFPILVGHSWGAMLALAYAAAHPDNITAIVIIGCGTFDQASRAYMEAERLRRTTAEMQSRMEKLTDEYPDPDQRLGAMGRLMQEIDSVDLVSLGNKTMVCDAKAHEQTWQDMLHLQQQGVYPGVFKAIRSPVLMLHGQDDPHPAEMIRDQLTRFIPQLEYHGWHHCGHYPWLEKTVAGDFYAVLIQWLLKQTAESNQ